LVKKERVRADSVEQVLVEDRDVDVHVAAQSGCHVGRLNARGG